jgi:DNA anti-recombination protein RmuC
MAGLKKQFETFTDAFEKLGTHLRHSQQSYDDANTKLSRARNSLEQMSQGALSDSVPEPDQRTLESAEIKLPGF